LKSGISKEALAQICADEIEKATNIVLLSGAGMSTSAGIPDFRGPNGIYKRQLGVNPEKIFDIDYFYENPRFFYDFHRKFLETLKTIKPTYAHKFFAGLEKNGKLKGVITQNIDSLHQMAGNKNVLEIHGGIWKSYCIRCKKTWNYEESIALAFSQDVPRCDQCGGVIKPDIVFFGEMVKHLEESQKLVKESDLLFVVGSSLVVTPAALLPGLAKGKIVIVNKGEINKLYLPQNGAILHVEEEIDEYFKSVNKFLGYKLP